MWNNQKISVVFPVYNEEAGILQAIEEFFAVSQVDEIIVVNNNSSDRSEEIVMTTRARLVNENNQGYGYALRRGLKEATGDLIILAEPDGTFLGRDLIKLLAYADDFEMVMGTRTSCELIWESANMHFFLRIGNLVVAKLLQLLFNTPSLSDCGCTLRLIHKNVLQSFVNDLTVGKSHFLPEMVVLARLNSTRMIEVPVNYKGRKGVSKITGSTITAIKVGLNMTLLILGYRVKSWLGLVKIRRSSTDKKALTSTFRSEIESSKSPVPNPILNGKTQSSAVPQNFKST
jgi:glycosyltransferase involved in cell wall biosynthesis